MRWEASRGVQRRALISAVALMTAGCSAGDGGSGEVISASTSIETTVIEMSTSLMSTTEVGPAANAVGRTGEPVLRRTKASDELGLPISLVEDVTLRVEDNFCVFLEDEDLYGGQVLVALPPDAVITAEGVIVTGGVEVAPGTRIDLGGGPTSAQPATNYVPVGDLDRCGVSVTTLGDPGQVFLVGSVAFADPG